MPEYTDFGIQARTIMLRKSISMSDIAKHCGVSISYISDILRGARKGNKQKEKIREFLGMKRGDIHAKTS